MENIELAIKIPKVIYENCKKECEENSVLIIDNYTYAIGTGTPLPKGHGRLGDLDALEKEMVNGIRAGNYEEGYETFAHINNMDDCVECVKYADTIIEADGGEE